MGGEQKWGAIAPALPAVSPLNPEREEYWTRFDDSVNAVSFGFVATAILISMFLVMAIFERFLRPRSPPAIGRPPSDLEAQMVFDGKPRYPSPKVFVFSSLQLHFFSLVCQITVSAFKILNSFLSIFLADLSLEGKLSLKPTSL